MNLPFPFVVAAALAALSAVAALDAAHAHDEAARSLDAGDRAEEAIGHARSDPAALSLEAEAERRALSALKRHLVSTAASVLALEGELTRLEDTLPRLDREERAAAASLAGRRDEAARLLAALQRLARRPEHRPVLPLPDPIAVLRGRLLLAAATPSLDRDARGLAADARRLHSLRRQIARQRRQHRLAVAKLGEERRVLAGLVEARSGGGGGPSGESGAARSGPDREGQGIRSIEALIDRLAWMRRATRLRPEDLVPGGPATGPAAASPGIQTPSRRASASRLPAAGPVIGRFGDPAPNGLTARGVTLRTRSSGQVVAPRAGRVVFAEPFLSYGELLIIDHGEGYHAMLAGLERLDARVGDDLVSGEPVGTMGTGSGVGDRLYIELRRGGRPIDPLPWLTENSDKVGG
ncbi:MAG: peptidoglycan DD-metalloendopeptidase family protein [Defluviicoccus sp.]|nr:peptidoglycan DD-metalloendopeptidase family protein [Defluviicoccus sp.]MDE0383597.1 peptidoglycan DD-metalloendopeptidase family protein [Defluviicoccus sp.]